MHAELSRRSWLFREWEVAQGETTYRLAYNGRGMGFESILRDGVPILRRNGFWWFIPRFDLEIDGVPHVVEVRIWPWISIRALRLTVAEQVLSTEGAAID